MNASTTYQFKISSKKLSSGKCQVKFMAKDEKAKSIRGYALVDSKVTLKEVVEQIEYSLKTRQYKPYFLNNLLINSQIPSTIECLIINS